MKMKAEHFNTLKTAISNVLEEYPNVASDYEKGRFARSVGTKDLQRRFCFDLLFGAGINEWVCNELYSYLNENHIYTALKKCTPVLERKF